MSKVISKVEDLNELKIDNDENYFELDYYKDVEQLRVNDWDDTLEIFNIKLSDVPTPYPTYTLSQIVEQLKTRYGFDIDYREEVKLSDREIELCKALKVLGYNWIARDGDDGELFAYTEKPIVDIEDSFWYNEDGRHCELDKQSFKFVLFNIEDAWEIPTFEE